LSCSGLTSITSLNATPAVITLGANVFSDVNKNACTLKVPTGSKTLYEAADQWKAFYHIEEGATAIENVEIPSITIYPNPVQDELKIENGELKIKNVQIFDLSGKIILHSQLSILHSISVANMPQGIYFIRIETDRGIVTKKFIKK